jgi:flagellin
MIPRLGFQEKVMSFSINTNIASLQAQQYLQTSANFQTQTIEEVTSGNRIVNSGDDAAGLAIANSLRSSQAVLNQGILNANDGLSTLQTLDGGINNIGTLLDRAQTLATQSASGTFSGDRGVLNSEFQSVIGEIDRQAQSIGLDTGGQFAKNLSVFIGGGRANNGTTAIANGSVAVNLSSSTVDSKSLGLQGVQAVGNDSIDIGTGSADTSVQAIVTNATNAASEATSGYTSFTFRGPGFGDANGVSVSVNLSGVTDTNTLTAAINTAISSAGNGSTQAATAFKNAGITASVVTDSNGSHLAFSSSNTAFQVSAGDLTSNALLGNTTSSSNPVGKSLTNTVTGGAATAASATTFGASGAGTVTFHLTGSSLAAPVDVSLAVTSGETIDTALSALSTAVANNSSLKAAGISLTTATAGSALVFSDAQGQQLNVASSGDLNNLFGLGSFQGSAGAGGTFNYSAVTGSGGTFAASAETLQFSLEGGSAISISATPTAATEAGALQALNAAFAANSTLSAAGFVAQNNGGQIEITNNSSTNFRVASIGATNKFGFNAAAATGVAQVANTQSALTTANTFDSGGAYQTSAFSFSTPTLGSDKQTITLTSDNSAGVQQSLAINLQNAGTPNAQSIDQAIDSINTAIQQSNNATLQQVVAVKEQSGGAEAIKFVGTSSFQVSAGQTADGAGLGNQGTLEAASVVGTGSTADISTQAGAANAVTALTNAVSALGVSQAAVGKGENNLNYAVALAQSQVTNEAAAESRIRDADLAAEAANLSKAQILVQAGTAALAQANSAPQAILSLLKG